MNDIATITHTITAAIAALPFTVRPAALRAESAWVTIITFARPVDGCHSIVARRVWVAEAEAGPGRATAPGYWTEVACAWHDGEEERAVTLFHRRDAHAAIEEALEDWGDHPNAAGDLAA